MLACCSICEGVCFVDALFPVFSIVFSFAVWVCGYNCGGFCAYVFVVCCFGDLFGLCCDCLFDCLFAVCLTG